MARDKHKKSTKGSQGFNRRNSDDFLQKNAAKAEITSSVSGLQYLIIDEGSGEVPLEDSVVEVHQRITLIDGTIVDDTYKTSEPARFSLTEAIEGYREGLLMMPVGSRRRFFIHPDLAWGKRGAGKKIGPNTVLIIDARLVRIL